MYGYMDHVLRTFYKATEWNDDNVYSHIIETSQSRFHLLLQDSFS